MARGHAEARCASSVRPASTCRTASVHRCLQTVTIHAAVASDAPPKALKPMHWSSGSLLQGCTQRAQTHYAALLLIIISKLSWAWYVCTYGSCVPPEKVLKYQRLEGPDQGLAVVESGTDCIGRGDIRARIAVRTAPVRAHRTWSHTLLRSHRVECILAFQNPWIFQHRLGLGQAAG